MPAAELRPDLWQSPHPSAFRAARSCRPVADAGRPHALRTTAATPASPARYFGAARSSCVRRQIYANGRVHTAILPRYPIIHEVGHHIGMSHPHDGQDPETGVDFDTSGEFLLRVGR